MMIFKNNPAFHAQASGIIGSHKKNIVTNNSLISKNDKVLRLIAQEV
ncbi:hypothetical protein LPB90_20415 [Chryseobacterium sp. LC2016-29]|nr:hypothetical protein [Chryseobacterium sp. LC2016-29]MCD0480813.1 hypothetical protein [Chryseobacterium sp. LC2016-29]